MQNLHEIATSSHGEIVRRPSVRARSEKENRKVWCPVFRVAQLDKPATSVVPTKCVCVRESEREKVCVCERERDSGREREREKDSERERGRERERE